jgi:hypothetical protein
MSSSGILVYTSLGNFSQCSLRAHISRRQSLDAHSPEERDCQKQKSVSDTFQHDFFISLFTSSLCVFIFPITIRVAGEGEQESDAIDETHDKWPYRTQHNSTLASFHL